MENETSAIVTIATAKAEAAGIGCALDFLATDIATAVDDPALAAVMLAAVDRARDRVETIRALPISRR